MHTTGTPTKAPAAWPRQVLQVNGAVTSGPDLSVEVNGLRLPNPFVIGSGAQGAASAAGARTNAARQEGLPLVMPAGRRAKQRASWGSDVGLLSKGQVSRPAAPILCLQGLLAPTMR